MPTRTRAAAATVAFVDACVALLPKVAAYAVFETLAWQPPVGGTDWLLAAAVALSAFVLAPYSYRQYRKHARPLPVTRRAVDRVRTVV
jgi:hypothetical protein